MTDTAPRSHVHHCEDDQRRRMRINGIWSYPLLVCFSVNLLLVGCGSTPAAPRTMPDLRGPGVSEVPGIDTVLPNRPAYHFIPSLGSYLAPARSGSSGTATPGARAAASPLPGAASRRLIVVFGFGPNSRYYDIGMDGSAPHPLPLRIPCVEQLAITPSGQWGACVTSQGIVTFRLLPLQPSSTAMAPLEEHLALPNDPQYGYGAVSWDPTGHYLSVARIPPAGSADDAPAPLDVFAVSPSYEQARLAIRFTSPFCFYDARWSPDGRWFFVSTCITGAMYLAPLAQLAPALPAFGAPTRYLSIPRAQFRALTHDVVWRPGTLFQATWIDAAGVLYQQNVNTGQVQRLAKFTPSGTGADTCATAWTVDGSQLLIALCVTGSDQVAGLPPKVFVYTTAGG